MPLNEEDTKELSRLIASRVTLRERLSVLASSPKSVSTSDGTSITEINLVELEKHIEYTDDKIRDLESKKNGTSDFIISSIKIT